jgi:regulatory protein
MATRRPPKLDENALWNYALRILGRKPYSAAELKQKLTLRALSAQDVPQVLTKLTEYGFANDEKFSESFATSRLNNDGFGRGRVMRDLRLRRVPQKVAEKAVEKTFAQVSESELIENYLARKYRSRNLSDFLQEEKNLASAYRRLRNAGFSSGASLAALKRHARAAADWDPPPEGES